MESISLVILEKIELKNPEKVILKSNLGSSLCHDSDTMKKAQLLARNTFKQEENCRSRL